MSYGLEVYNSAGAKILGVDDRCPRFHGNFTVPSFGAGTIFVSVPGMTTDGTWFADTFDTQFNVTWNIDAGGVSVRNASSSASSQFVLAVFRG
jgi:hypothetical protein